MQPGRPLGTREAENVSCWCRCLYQMMTLLVILLVIFNASGSLSAVLVRACTQVYGMVDADWHDGHEEQTEAVREYFTVREKEHATVENLQRRGSNHPEGKMAVSARSVRIASRVTPNINPPHVPRIETQCPTLGRIFVESVEGMFVFCCDDIPHRRRGCPRFF